MNMSIDAMLDEIDRQVAIISVDTDANYVAAAEAYATDAELELIEQGVSIKDAVALVDLDILSGVLKK